MKRHLQKTGVRKFFGQDLIDLQSEPLKALDGFFAEYGACIITGCEITAAENDTFNVAPGLVAIEITEPETGKTAIKVMPFDGAEGVILPLYITANHTTVERVYGDGKVKPIAYDFHAVASGITPETPHITLTTEGGNRFVDVLQDDKHSFITAQERSKWNAILQAAKDYADIKKAEAISTAAADASTKSEATLRTSKEYTDGKDAVLRNDMTIADTATLRSAKTYADTIVAALVDNSPEALNTLQELAKALGNDPNFATTVMQAIGERMKTTDVNAALAGKSNTPVAPWFAMQLGECSLLNANNAGVLKWQHKNGDGVFIDDIVYHSGNLTPQTIRAMAVGLDSVDPNSIFQSGAHRVFAGPNVPNGAVTGSMLLHMNWDGNAAQQIITGLDSDRMWMRRKIGAVWQPWVEIYHSGNLGAATQQGAGLMSAADKTKLDNITGGLLAGYQIHTSGSISQRYGPKASSASLVTKIGTGKCRVPHNIGNSNYIAIVTAVGTVDNATRGIYNAAVMQQGDNAVDVILSDSTNGSPINGTFNIVLMGLI